MDQKFELAVFNDQHEVDLLADDLYLYEGDHFLAIPFANAEYEVWKRTVSILNNLPAFAAFLQSLSPQEVFDVSMSASAQELYAEGKLVLRAAKSGNGLIPVLADSSGRFVEQVRLNPKSITPDLATSLNSLSTQRQLAEIVSQLETMNESLRGIDQGQRDDRLALALSAKQKLIEAFAIEDSDTKRAALLSAVSTANDSRYQLMESMKSDVRQIVQSKKDKVRNDCLRGIRQSFSRINLATGISVTAYNALGEERAMLVALKGYQSFISQTLLANYDEDHRACELLHSWDYESDGMWLRQPEEVEGSIRAFISESITQTPALESASRAGTNGD